MAKTKLHRFIIDDHTKKLEKNEVGHLCSYYNVQQLIEEYESEIKKLKSKRQR